MILFLGTLVTICSLVASFYIDKNIVIKKAWNKKDIRHPKVQISGAILLATYFYFSYVYDSLWSIGLVFCSLLIGLLLVWIDKVYTLNLGAKSFYITSFGLLIFILFNTYNQYWNTTNVPSYSTNALESLSHSLDDFKPGSTSVAKIENSEVIYRDLSATEKPSKARSFGAMLDGFYMQDQILKIKYKASNSEFEKYEINQQLNELTDSSVDWNAFYMLKGQNGYIHRFKIKNKYYSFLVLRQSEDLRKFINLTMGVNVKPVTKLFPAKLSEFSSSEEFADFINLSQKISDSDISNWTSNDTETPIPYKKLINIMNTGSSTKSATSSKNANDESTSEEPIEDSQDSSKDVSSSTDYASSTTTNSDQLTVDEMKKIALKYLADSGSTANLKNTSISENQDGRDQFNVIYDFTVHDTPDHVLDIQVNSYTGNAYNYSLSLASGSEDGASINVGIPTFNDKESDLLSQINSLSNIGDFRKGGQALNMVQPTIEHPGTFEMDFTNINNQDAIVRVYIDMLTFQIVHYTDGEMPEIIPNFAKSIH